MACRFCFLNSPRKSPWLSGSGHRWEREIAVGKQGSLINSSWLDYQASDCSVETSCPSLPFPSHRVFFLSSEMFGVGMSPWTDKKVHRPRDVAGRSHAPLPVECSQGLIFIKTNRFKLFLICYVKVTLKRSQKLLTIPQLFIFATFKMLFIYRFCCFTLIHTQTFKVDNNNRNIQARQTGNPQDELESN